jgi:hypothetical protein
MLRRWRDRRHERHVQHARPVIVGEHHDQPTGWIQECVVACWHIDDSGISRPQSKRLSRIDRFAQRSSSHIKVYFIEPSMVSISSDPCNHECTRINTNHETMRTADHTDFSENDEGRISNDEGMTRLAKAPARQARAKCRICGPCNPWLPVL